MTRAARTLVVALVGLAGLACGPIDEAEPARLPLLIVPGWGSEIADSYYAEMIGNLQRDGYPRAEIHLLGYGSRDSLDRVEQQLQGQLKAVFARYGADQRFDVITHSTGHFVGLYALMEGGHAARVRRYVGIAGIAFGWNGGEVCDKYVDCGEAHKKLRPYKNPFVMAFHQRHAEAIGRLDKCSLFSPADGLVTPYDAGRFPDGVNVEVPGMGHLNAAYDLKYYQLMRARCFGDGDGDGDGDEVP